MCTCQLQCEQCEQCEHPQLCLCCMLMQAVGQGRPGSYLFIEGAFYNDMRAAGAEDYSRPVSEFCR